MPAGRPSDYTPELVDSICEQIAEGNSLVTVLKAEGMPSYTTVMRWVDKHEEFREKYTRACEVRAETMADEILEIADDSEGDFTEGEDGPAYNAEHVQRSKLRVDSRKWLLSKMMPKKYGDKIQQEVTGPEGAQLVMHIYTDKQEGR